MKAFCFAFFFFRNTPKRPPEEMPMHSVGIGEYLLLSFIALYLFLQRLMASSFSYSLRQSHMIIYIYIYIYIYI